MTINVNNQLQSVEEYSSIVALLAQLNIATKGVAIAINDVVISKTSWDTTFFNSDDHITIIQATQGG